MLIGTLDGNKRRTVTTDAGATTLHVNYLLTSPEGGSPSPQVFLVEQDSHETLRTHFHFNSQFQIFISGSGTIGRHEAKPYVVQYAEGQSGYGPITAGDGGLGYLSLRSTTIPERAQYLPESKKLLDRSLRKRQLISKPMLAVDGGEINQVRTLIEPTADGLGAWFVQVAAGSTQSSPVAANGSGRYYVIVRGELMTRQECVPALSVVWTGQDEEPIELPASPEGLEVIVVQFPQPAQ